MAREERDIARALKQRQDERARVEDDQARRADDPAAAQTHRRRADKARYLREKLAEAEKA